MIDVSSKLTCYEVNGVESKGPPWEIPKLEVESHTIGTWVVLTFSGNSITVSARDLHAAITNATNKGF